MKKVLFIAPFPPPVTGVSVASQKIIENLSDKYEFINIDFSRKNLNSPGFSINQFFNAFNNIIDIIKYRGQIDLSYLTVSQSKFGNLKDLLYIFMLRKNKIIIHLHGGGIKKMVFDRYSVLYKMNKFLMKKVNTVVVLSESLSQNYTDFIDESKISVIRNFADEAFFLSDKQIVEKYSNVKKRILYLSNLIPGKGYVELLEGFLALPAQIRNKYQLNFAGAFANDNDEAWFIDKISDEDDIDYHGIVRGTEKRTLLERASIFCLPSYFPYMEGQPISILEAYASGCVVVSTDHGGIKDIFTSEVNGYQVEKASSQSIMETLVKIHEKDLSELISIGISNRNEAKKQYTEEKYLEKIDALFRKIISE